MLLITKYFIEKVIQVFVYAEIFGFGLQVGFSFGNAKASSVKYVFRVLQNCVLRC